MLGSLEFGLDRGAAAVVANGQSHSHGIRCPSQIRAFSLCFELKGTAA
jgi:hypothetical protein